MLLEGKSLALLVAGYFLLRKKFSLLKLTLNQQNLRPISVVFFFSKRRFLVRLKIDLEKKKNNLL